MSAMSASPVITGKSERHLMFRLSPSLLFLTDIMVSPDSFPYSICVLNAQCHRMQSASQFGLFQQLIFNGPKFLRQIHVIGVWIFKALNLIPKSFHLLGTVRLDFI